MAPVDGHVHGEGCIYTYPDCDPVPEFACEDCMDADHEVCRREGGWPHQDSDERCGCHLTGHALDNRRTA